MGEITNQAFLTHIVNDLARRIKCPLGFSVFHVQKIFKYLAEHLRIDGNFALHWLIFYHGEVIAIKDIQNTISISAVFICIRKQFVRDTEVIVLPIVPLQFLEQTTIKKGDAAVQRQKKRFISTILVEPLIKKRL